MTLAEQLAAAEASATQAGVDGAKFAIMSPGYVEAARREVAANKEAARFRKALRVQNAKGKRR